MIKVSNNNARHYKWGNDCDSWVLVEVPDLSVKMERIPPGESDQPHRHKFARQFFFITAGKATFQFEDTSITMEEGEGIFVPPGTKHFICNHMHYPLWFFVISQPSVSNDRENT